MKAKRISSVIAALLALAMASPSVASEHDGTRSDAGAELSAQVAAGPAKHILLFIGDGMNIEHEIAASRYLHGKSFALKMHEFPYQGSLSHWDVTTYDYWCQGRYDPKALDPTCGYDPRQGGKKPYPLAPELDGAKAYLTAQATDSASSATAWATGYKTDDGNIAWLPGDPADGKLETIAETLRKQLGRAIGVVSTVPFSHATPAAHVSHNVFRNNYHEIAAEILGVTRPEVVIGGGHPGYDGSPTFKYISREVYEAARNGDYADYVFVERKAGEDGGLNLLSAAQKAAAGGKKLFGLFGLEGAGHFESAEPQDLPGTPSLKAATNENPTLAEATLAALKVLSQDEDGFFVMIEQGDIDWANHANDFKHMIASVTDLDRAIRAAIDFVNQSGDAMDWSNTLLIATADHSNSYLRNIARLPAGDLPRQESSPTGFSYDPSEVTYGSARHTNELTRIYAKGAGAGIFRRYERLWYKDAEILDNTQLYQVMREAAGLPTAAYLEVARPPRPEKPSL